MPTSGIVRSPVRSENAAEGGGAPMVSALRSVTPTGGTGPVLGIDDTFEVPEGHDCIYVWVGPFALNETAFVWLHVNIGGATRAIAARRDGFLCIPAAAGKKFCFRAQRRTGASATPTSAGVMPTLRFATGVKPAALGAVATNETAVGIDVNAIPLWAPETVHVVLPAQNERLTIKAAATPRVIYVSERDEEGEYSHPRALVIGANETRSLQLRYRDVAFACMEAVYGGSASIIVYVPDGTVFPANAQRVVEAPFTVVRTVNCSNVSQLKAALTDAQNGDDIVLDDGTYDMRATGDRIAPANYLTTMQKQIRIRSASEDRDACIVQGSWDINLAIPAAAWIVKSITMDFDGVAPIGNGSIQTRGGTVWIVDCVLTGEGTGANDKSLSHFHSSYATRHYLVGCVVQGAKDDAVDASNDAAATLTVVGCLIDGNGDGANDQLATCHGGATVELWNCRFSDAANTANAPKIVPDANSTIAVRYCVQSTGLISHSGGLVMQTIRAVEGCILPECAADVSIKTGYIIGSRLTMIASSGNFLQPNAGTTDGRWTGANLLIGSRFTATNSSGANCLQIQSTSGTPHELEFHGCEFRAQHSSNGSCCRFTDASNPPFGSVLFANCRFIAAGTSNLFRLDNVSAVATIRNCIFGGSTSYTVNASGSTGNVCTGSIHQGAKPSNWDARFTGAQTGTVFSTAPALESDGSPTSGGNCDETGLDLGWYGMIDAHGKPLLQSASPQRGPIARVTVPSSPLLVATTY